MFVPWSTVSGIIIYLIQASLPVGQNNITLASALTLLCQCCCIDSSLSKLLSWGLFVTLIWWWHWCCIIDINMVRHWHLTLNVAALMLHCQHLYFVILVTWEELPHTLGWVCWHRGCIRILLNVSWSSYQGWFWWHSRGFFLLLKINFHVLR